MSNTWTDKRKHNGGKPKYKNHHKQKIPSHYQFWCSEEYQEECDRSEQLYEEECHQLYEDCYNEIIKKRLDENYVCWCCNSLFCDYFDEFEATRELYRKCTIEKKKNIEKQKKMQPPTFSC